MKFNTPANIGEYDEGEMEVLNLIKNCILKIYIILVHNYDELLEWY